MQHSTATHPAMRERARQPRPDGSDRARERFLRAIVELLETRDADVLTVDVMVRAASLSRATFYRQFADRDAALGAAFERSVERIVGLLPPLDGRIGDCARERARTGAWASALVNACLNQSRRRRSHWRPSCEAQLRAYLERLRERRVLLCDDAAQLARGALDVVEGAIGRAIAGRPAGSAAEAEAAAIVARLVFGDQASGTRSTR